MVGDSMMRTLVFGSLIVLYIAAFPHARADELCQHYAEYKLGMLPGVTDKLLSVKASAALMERYNAPAPHDYDLPAVGTVVHIWTKKGQPGGYMVFVRARDGCVLRAGLVDADTMPYLFGKGPLPARFGHIYSGI